MCAENFPGQATQKGCLTARQELSRHRHGLASPDNSDTHGSNAGRGPASTRPQDCALVRLAWLRAGYSNDCTSGGPRSRQELQATHRWLQYKSGDVVRRHRWRTGAGGVTGYTMAGPVKDWRRRAAAPVEDREPADIGGARPESWTGGGAARARTREAPGRTGRHPRCAVTRVLICDVGALVITPRDLMIDSMLHWSIVGSVGPLHGPGRQRSHASAGQPGRTEDEDQLGPTRSHLGPCCRKTFRRTRRTNQMCSTNSLRLRRRHHRLPGIHRRRHSDRRAATLRGSGPVSGPVAGRA
jgi:hypothetical protein